ncbi:MAG: nicotinate (nicotinamide) nucleotide adenylyltransferase [Campylobacterales bacterium]|nr:nicotinate (nicotinamide) nucleotide adenylyltransferase [Campylobacterales bacterium]
MKTVALYGGSFDPPHIGHEAVVKALQKKKFIDKIIIMPTFLNPFKSKFVAPASLRLKWLQEIFSPFQNVLVSDYEVKLGKKTPSIETVEYLLQSYEKIYLVIGADNLSSLSTWYQYDKLQQKVTFIIASRNGVEIPSKYIKINVNEDVSSSMLRKQIDIKKLPKINAKEIETFYKEYNAK